MRAARYVPPRVSAAWAASRCSLGPGAPAGRVSPLHTTLKGQPGEVASPKLQGHSVVPSLWPSIIQSILENAHVKAPASMQGDTHTHRPS